MVQTMLWSENRTITSRKSRVLFRPKAQGELQCRGHERNVDECRRDGGFFMDRSEGLGPNIQQHAPAAIRYERGRGFIAQSAA